MQQFAIRPKAPLPSCIDHRGPDATVRSLMDTSADYHHSKYQAVHSFMMRQMAMLQLWEKPVKEKTMIDWATLFIGMQDIHATFHRVVSDLLEIPYARNISGFVRNMYIGMQWIELYFLETPPRSYAYVYVNDDKEPCKVDPPEDGLCPAILAETTQEKCQNTCPGGILCHEHAMLLVKKGVLATVNGGSYRAAIMIYDAAAMTALPSFICATRLIMRLVHQMNVVHGFVWDMKRPFPFKKFPFPYLKIDPPPYQPIISDEPVTPAKSQSQSRSPAYIQKAKERGRQFLAKFRAEYQMEASRGPPPLLSGKFPPIALPDPLPEDINAQAGEDYSHALIPTFMFHPGSVSMMKTYVFKRFVQMRILGKV